MYLTHRTTEGERWDQIAYRYYGDPFAYADIIAANPELAITPTLPSGALLLIPVIERASTLSTDDLPPWKR
jgi:phage tail protein X